MTIEDTNTVASTSAAQERSVERNGFSMRSLLTGHNLFMMACCAAMVAGTGILIWSAPAGQTIGQTLLLGVPMLGCIGMHLVMHRFMGKSCHSTQSSETKEND
ncbi:DUF2933 domain-containing protein [Roseibium aggregatum]|uniref:DUF2933 domain-containing protein n=1 Tax=Roseibium aggregatum TaxID=187304 RepID=A0A926P3A1_9HYPH|nr:DUF2933 domain-containing protein [Roseibium aggregatum]MBD1548793.1 DUF2933 domain-containing protein [Roseibium aggregatum]